MCAGFHVITRFNPCRACNCLPFVRCVMDSSVQSTQTVYVSHHTNHHQGKERTQCDVAKVRDRSVFMCYIAAQCVCMCVVCVNECVLYGEVMCLAIRERHLLRSAERSCCLRDNTIVNVIA